MIAENPSSVSKSVGIVSSKPMLFATEVKMIIENLTNLTGIIVNSVPIPLLNGTKRHSRYVFTLSSEMQNSFVFFKLYCHGGKFDRLILYKCIISSSVHQGDCQNPQVRAQV